MVVLGSMDNVRITEAERDKIAGEYGEDMLRIYAEKVSCTRRSRAITTRCKLRPMSVRAD
jgi:hypothetical protein